MSTQSTVMPRRSPRTVEKFCNGVTLGIGDQLFLSTSQMALLLSFAHCSGWSADHISLAFHAQTQILIPGQRIWHLHIEWVRKRGGLLQLSTKEAELADILIRNEGFVPHPNFQQARPLCTTPIPMTVQFSLEWSPVTGQPLFPGWTQEVRNLGKAWYGMPNDLASIRYLTPWEGTLLQNLFGSYVKDIVAQLLEEWGRFMQNRYGYIGLQIIPERDHLNDINYIMRTLRLFEQRYEFHYGKIECNAPGRFGEYKDNTVYIRSLGYGTKVFLGLMMADRLAVLRRRTLNARALIGFVEMDKTELEQDTQCPICLMDMNEDTPIQLIICCKQVLGAECLKHWLREVVPGIGAFRQNCPHCRAQFPDFFVQKLFGGEQYIQRYFAQGHVQVENQLEGGLPREANGTPVSLWSLTVENEHVGMEE